MLYGHNWFVWIAQTMFDKMSWFGHFQEGNCLLYLMVDEGARPDYFVFSRGF